VKLSGSKEPSFQFSIQIPSKAELMDGFHETNQQFYRMSLDQFKDFFIVVVVVVENYSY
jgi:hypothetical protein